jgi:phosphohistidine phosphatase
MKKIVLLRHAKSSWDDFSIRDHDRPLAPRGWRDMPIMANRLKAKQIIPDLILSSSALRAIQTAEIIIQKLGLRKSTLVLEEKLYHASASEILNQLRSRSNKVKTLFLIGHNPGFNGLIALLGGDIDNLPTSGQFGFTAHIDSWEQLNSTNAKTWYIDYPKKYD